MFQPELIHLFISHQQFLLLETALRFYNCPELITRTSIFNNVFALLSHKPVREYLATCEQRRPFYLHIADQLTKQFKQELAEYCLRLSHTSQSDDVGYIMNELDDKLIFWEDLSKSVDGC